MTPTKPEAEAEMLCQRHGWDAEMLKEILALIKAGRAASGWVSVEERLPEEDKYVLLFDGKDLRVGMLTHETGTWEESYHKVQYWIDTDENWTPDFEEVTHWMHLPTPPAASGKGEK